MQTSEGRNKCSANTIAHVSDWPIQFFSLGHRVPIFVSSSHNHCRRSFGRFIRWCAPFHVTQLGDPISVIQSNGSPSPHTQYWAPKISAVRLMVMKMSWNGRHFRNSAKHGPEHRIPTDGLSSMQSSGYMPGPGFRRAPATVAPATENYTTLSRWPHCG